MTITRRYWDANCFLGWFNDEPDKIEKCKSVVEAAEAGELQIVTSALTLTEVIKLKGHPSLPAEREERIRTFFENPFIIIRNVDRRVGETARHLIWSHSFLKPKDSIHVATALLSVIPVLDTFDGELIGLDGKLGDPPLRIGKPDLPRQGLLFAQTTSAPSEAGDPDDQEEEDPDDETSL